MISFAVVEISLLFRCVLISGKGQFFCGADGVWLVGWANGVVFFLASNTTGSCTVIFIALGNQAVSASWEARRHQWLCPPGSS